MAKKSGMTKDEKIAALESKLEATEKELLLYKELVGYVHLVFKSNFREEYGHIVPVYKNENDEE